MPTPSPACPGRSSIERLLRSLLADEIGRMRGAPSPTAESLLWTHETPLGEAGIGLDSLGLWDAAGRVNQFFQLHRAGASVDLRRRRSFGGWTDAVIEALSGGAGALAFETSGSTGAPRLHLHALAELREEAGHWAMRLAGRRRIISLVPAHHIYGCIWTALLPERLGAPCLDARGWAPGEFAERLAPGDLIVATPFLWRFLDRSLGGFPPDCEGVTSTAPMARDLWGSLLGKGLWRLSEAYGSTELGGVGARTGPDEPFDLLPVWTRAAAGLRRAGGAGEPASPPDRLEWIDDGRFRLGGRLDGAIQVGGINVHAERVAEAIRRRPGVSDCAVRPTGDPASQAGVRLKAFVVPASNADLERLRAELAAWMREALLEAERPASLTFGDSLPVTAMGKPADW